jgi:Zn-dependent protease
MGYQDRPYYRDRDSQSNPLMWLLSGSLPLFTVFGIRVRAHASMIVMAVLVLLFGLGQGFTWQDRVQSMTVLFGIVLLHEFGHCFAARWVGGSADDILMWPLGGLAFASPPHRPLATFITVAAGPAVNVLICVVCGLGMWAATGSVPLNPFKFSPVGSFEGWFDIYRYAFWIFQISWMLLVFNLLPIYPLDGGQMVQAALWPKFGYFKSMNFSLITGMVGAVLGGMIALASGAIGLGIMAAFGFMNCLNMRRALIAAGPSEFEDDNVDYSAAYEIDPVPRRKRVNRRAANRARRQLDAERAERENVDAILAKVSREGMQSLTWAERRTLKKATEHQRQRDMEATHSRH